MRRKWTFTAAVAVAIAAVSLACGGGSKNKAPAIAPTSDSDDGDPDAAPPWSETLEKAAADGGAGASGDGGGGGGGEPGATAAGEAGGAQGNEEGARALLKPFLDPKADHAALTKSLRPTSADYQAMFDAATAAKVEAAQAKEWDSGRMVVKPKDKQTEIKLASATGAELAAGTGHAKDFPGGYKKIGKHLAPGVTFFAFKFVAPGKDAGMAYDGLSFVNGHWVIAPKPWRALDGDGGGGAGGSGGGGGAHGGRAKPHGKPHKKKK